MHIHYKSCDPPPIHLKHISHVTPLKSRDPYKFQPCKSHDLVNLSHILIHYKSHDPSILLRNSRDPIHLNMEVTWFCLTLVIYYFYLLFSFTILGIKLDCLKIWGGKKKSYIVASSMGKNSEVANCFVST